MKLKRVIEKLQVENKHLKGTSSRQSSITTASYMSQNDRKKEETFEKLRSDHEKLQKNYEAVTKLYTGKISELQIELELSKDQSTNFSCPHCNKKSFDELPSHNVDLLIKQNQQKDVLLDKAKLLLQRAAEKDNLSKEKIASLKRRVSELEGLPIISEENSDSL